MLYLSEMAAGSFPGAIVSSVFNRDSNSFVAGYG